MRDTTAFGVGKASSVTNSVEGSVTSVRSVGALVAFSVTKSVVGSVGGRSVGVSVQTGTVDGVSGREGTTEELSQSEPHELT